MSIVRNLTRRARAHTRGEENIPRSGSVKFQPGTISRAQISLPKELLSTTNVHALNAPDIKRSDEFSTSSSAASMNSDNDRSFLTSDTSTLGDASPITPTTSYSDGFGGNSKDDFFSSKPVPAVPARAASHSKKAHVAMSRELSVKRSMSPPPSDLSDSRTNTSVFSSPKRDLTSSHPFGRELAQVAEVAEGFGASAVLDEEEQEMMTKGLRKFSVEDYVAEITGQNGGVYEDKFVLNPWM